MEKIKQVLSPGKKTDDEMMYGSGNNTTHGVSGEGSHFDHTGNARLNDPNTAAQPVHGQAFTSQANPTGSMANTTGIRPESNIHQENYRGQQPYSSGSGATGYGSSTAGPHSSNMANKADPRVDSDLDGRSGMPGSHSNTTAGPHSSNIANKADPRVDSDLDGRSGMGNTHSSTGQSGYNTGVTGSNYGSTTSGPHSSNMANKADPRVDSDRDGRSGMGNTHHNTTSSGVAGSRNDAGPVHDSKILNKLDPRVDEKRLDNTSSTRQNMPGRFPSETQNDGVHNPYTSHEVDPRIGGSTQQASHQPVSGMSGQNTTGTQGPSSQHMGGKGLNAARTEDYSQDRSTGHSHQGRDAAAIGGAGLAGAAVGHNHGTHHTEAENRHLTVTGDGASGAPVNPTQGGSIVDDRRASRRGSAVNLPPPQGALAAGMMTDFGQSQGSHGSHNTHGTTHGSANNGPHDSAMMNKLDPRVDSDRDGRSGMGNTHNTHNTHGTTGSGLTGSSNYGSTNAGPHDSNVANKMDPRVDSDRDGRSGMTGSHNTHGTTGGLGSSNYGSSTTAGPHSSNMANKADPRVDSDRDGRSGLGNTHHNTQDTRNTHDNQGGLLSKVKSALTGGAVGGAAAHHSTHGNEYDNRGTSNVSGSSYGTQGYSGAGEIPVSQSEYARGNTSTNAGPHGTLGNKLDPRVDSDLDGRSGIPGSSHTHGTHGTTAGSGLTGSNYGSTNAGPHDSNVANKMDPRVDSDRDRRSGMGGGMGSSNYGSTNVGPHDSNVANKMDPRVDSDRDGRSARHGSTHPSGLTGQDAGAHTSAHTRAAATARLAGDGRSHGIGSHGSNTSGVGSAHQKPIPLDGVELPRGNQYGQDVKDPRYGLPMSAGGVTAAEAQHLRHDDGHMTSNVGHDNHHDNLHDKRHGNTTHGTTHEKEHRSSLLGFLHRDKNKKYTKEEEAEFDRQEREHHSRSGLTGAGVGAATIGAGVGAHHHAETNKPLPPNPAQQQQMGTSYNQGQQLNLTDRTRQHGDTTSAPAYSGGMVDAQGNPIREQNTMGGEIPYDQSQYNRGTTTGGMGSSTYGSTNAGPHDSNVANKMDPRVDSDRDGRSGMGGGMSSSNYGSTNAGPHDSNVANKMDPRVDSDRDGRGGIGSSNYGSTNAGPHDSALMNKADPRVDSDRDHRAGQGMTGSAYPQGASDGRDYPAGGMGTGEGIQTKVLEKEDGHKVLHKKGNIIHPGAGAGEPGYRGDASGPTGDNY